nr:Bax inhibitor-1/YccA family protein [Oceanibacterium hippocampi]
MDEGLRSYMLRVYNYMGSGLALSGAIAAYVASSPSLMQAIFGSGLGMVAMLAPIAIIFAMSFGVNRFGTTTLQALYWVFVALMGLSLAMVFAVYTAESITRVFFITAGTFGAMSLFGYTTKRDLSGMGSFLIMGLIGIVIASVVNIFLASSMLQFVVSVLGVLIFTGLTAYDTQRIKSQYYHGHSDEILQKSAIMGALSLYLNFYNLFIMLMHLFGNRE